MPLCRAERTGLSKQCYPVVLADKGSQCPNNRVFSLLPQGPSPFGATLPHHLFSQGYLPPRHCGSLQHTHSPEAVWELSIVMADIFDTFDKCLTFTRQDNNQYESDLSGRISLLTIQIII